MRSETEVEGYRRRRDGDPQLEGDEKSAFPCQ